MDKTTFNCCVGVGCHGGCIHRTHVVDGKIQKVENFTYPDGEKGLICVKKKKVPGWWISAF